MQLFIEAYKKGFAHRVSWELDGGLVERGYLTEIFPSFYKPTEKGFQIYERITNESRI